MASDRLRLTVLGGFNAGLVSGAPLALTTRKTRALVTYLALKAGQRLSRETLMALLWGDQTDEQARRNLRHSLWELRRACGPAHEHLLRADNDAVSLDPAHLDCDVLAFERAVLDATPEAFARAAVLYRGELLDGFSLKEVAFQDWLRGERSRLRAEAIRALEWVLAHQTQSGAREHAVATARRVVAIDPLREPVHRALMRLYLALGQRGAAARQYEVCADILRRELGLMPDRETERVRAEIVGQPRTETPRTAPRPTAAARAREAFTPDVPLVDRRADLDRLLAGLAQAERGASAVIAVFGEAGIGKTRLVTELAREATVRGARVLVGRSHDDEQVLPLGPWLEALAPIADGPGDRGAWRRALSGVRGGARDRPSASGAIERRQVFEAIAHTLQDLARTRPLVLVLEDLHWADDLSVRLLAFAARRLAFSPLLIVATVRMEQLIDAPLVERTLASLAPARLTLGPLSHADTLRLVAALAPEADADTLGPRVWQISEGHPLMTVEAVREALLGAAASEPDTLPARIHELVASRLQRLSAPGRHLAAVAAVIGRPFGFGLLQRAAAMGEARAAAAIEELVRRRVLEPVGEDLRFTHPRIRDVVYDAILPPLRTRLHDAVARAGA
jgi:DNA-binding SARP family transcriptional activator